MTGPEGEAKVAEEVDRHVGVAAQLDVAPVVNVLHGRAEAIVTSELERSGRRVQIVEETTLSAVFRRAWSF